MVKRLITERQEQALRLCHHNFGGMTQTEAAAKMGITQPTINRLLAAAKKTVPQMFPILTKFEAKCYHYYMTEGGTVKQIAIYMNTTQNAIYKALHRVKDKGKYFSEDRRKMLSYEPAMHDHQVREKF